MRLIVAGVAALLLKLFLAASTAGTNDVHTWEHDLDTLRTAGFAELYRSGAAHHQAFIHPPAVLHGLRFLGAVQDLTGLPLRFWLSAADAFADAGTLALLWRMFGDSVPLLVALSPISILISGFHGNTDPIMIFFLVATVFFAERGNPGRVGLAFGLACSVKLIPLIFAPAILLCLPGFRARYVCLAASTVVWVGLSMPYLAQEPVLIMKSMLGYGSATGLWGFSLLATVLGAGDVYDPAAKWIALLAASCLPGVIKETVRRPLFKQCGLVALTFLVFSPGFGLQYLVWAVPWTVSFDRRSMIAYHAVTGIFALTVYFAASQNTPAGIYADLLNANYFGVLATMGMVCWITIAAIIYRDISKPVVA